VYEAEKIAVADPGKFGKSSGSTGMVPLVLATTRDDSNRIRTFDFSSGGVGQLVRASEFEPLLFVLAHRDSFVRQA